MSSLPKVLVFSGLFACGVESGTPVPGEDYVSEGGTAALADVRCTGAPAAGSRAGWLQLRSHLISGLGDSHHRGVDLIATTDDLEQTLTGRITYGKTDQDLERENVSLFACVDSTWTRLGSARTSDGGWFKLTLSGDARLAEGMRDLYVSVDGDRTGARFLALVAPAGTRVMASDIDGTLTSSESAYPEALVLGRRVDAQESSAATLASAAAKGVAIVYLSSRGNQFTQDSREWLVEKGFPRGPLVLASPLVTLPGEDTIEYKTAALERLDGFELVAGFGNRATDVAAYANVGLTPDRIFIKLPEFAGELADDIKAGRALGFHQYATVKTNELAALLGDVAGAAE
jgi:phosphatidate phosphatase PAH1